MRTLIVEDETRIADFLQRGLRAEGHFCIVANHGVTGLSLAKDGCFDLVLLDLVLPDMHGHEVCQQLRMKQINTPLIILSAMDSLDDVIAGLRMGADDYMTKPFSFEELLARIEAAMRRNSAITSQEQMLKVGPLTFDRQSLRFSVDGKDIKMTARELAIIELLMNYPGTLFSRERILNNVWGLDTDPLTNVVDVYIGKLRKKIDCGSGSSMIETVRGIGYRLNFKEKSLISYH
jgi:two-component system OmpR family response regulator